MCPCGTPFFAVTKLRKFPKIQEFIFIRREKPLNPELTAAGRSLRLSIKIHNYSINSFDGMFTKELKILKNIAL